MPAFNYRPKSSASTSLALGHLDDAGPDARAFRFGFIASSDNHSARPGTGYKERDRLDDDRGARRAGRARLRLLTPQAGEPKAPEPRDFDTLRDVAVAAPGARLRAPGVVLRDRRAGRRAREGRDRDAIWEALLREEVYGTSGPRILLWFDLLNGAAARPMGSEVRLAESAALPRARRRRASSSSRAAPATPSARSRHERLERLCRGECFHPGDRRGAASTRIEVVRIRPRRGAGEPARR